MKKDYAVIIIDNSDIVKPTSRKLEALSKIRVNNTGKTIQGYLTVEATILSKKGKMSLPVYEKVFCVAEKELVSGTMKTCIA